MKIKFTFIIIAFSLVTSSLLANENFEIKEVTKEDLQASKNDVFGEAKAVMLYFDKDTYFSYSGNKLNVVTKVKKRIKFYGNKSGAFKNAIQTIYVYEGDYGREHVSNIKGVTYNLVNGKIEKEKLRRDGIFEEQIRDKLEKVSFTLPAVKKGSIIEFEYKIVSPYFWDLDEFKMQFDIPVMKGRIKISYPKSFLFYKSFKGFHKIAKFHEKKKDYRFGGKVNVDRYIVNHVPSLKTESYVDNINNYRLGVVYELSVIRYSNGKVERFSLTWNDLVEGMIDTEDYKYKINRTGVFEDQIDQLIAEGKDTLTTVKEIYNYVKNRIKWNGKKREYFEKGIKEAFKERVGNSADINLTLVAMLRYAGIDANPIILSTRDNMKPVFPSRERLNYVIALAKVSGKYYFMDATEKYARLNMLPIRDYNWKGILLDGENWQFVNLMQPARSQSSKLLKIEVTPDFSVKGSVKSRLTNHYAYFYKKKLEASDREEYIRKKESDLGDIVISDYKTEYNKKGLGRANMSFSYASSKSLTQIGDKIFINPLLFFAEEENPFKAKTRDFPINFGFPYRDRLIVNIKVPKGYVVESVPQSIQINLGNGLGKFKYLISYKNNRVNLSMVASINKAEIDNSFYPVLQKFFTQVIAKQQEKIVFRKI